MMAIDMTKTRWKTKKIEYDREDLQRNRGIESMKDFGRMSNVWLFYLKEARSLFMRDRQEIIFTLNDNWLHGEKVFISWLG